LDLTTKQTPQGFNMLSSSQLTALKSAIAANSTVIPPYNAAINTLLNTSDHNDAIAKWYNEEAAFTVWKTNVPINDVGKKFNGSDLSGLTTGNQTRLQTIAAFLAGGVNPSLPDNRAFFDDVFSGAGGTNTRANLLALWKRSARNIEKLFATGTGSDAIPATLVFEGAISYQDVEAARNR
jgi:hypothetical protein